MTTICAIDRTTTAPKREELQTREVNDRVASLVTHKRFFVSAPFADCSRPTTKHHRTFTIFMNCQKTIKI